MFLVLFAAALTEALLATVGVVTIRCTDDTLLLNRLALLTPRADHVDTVYCVPCEPYNIRSLGSGFQFTQLCSFDTWLSLTLLNWQRQGWRLKL